MIGRYRIFEADGSDAGEAHYAVLIQAGETIYAGDGRKLRVLEVAPTEENPSEYVGMVRRAAASDVELRRTARSVLAQACMR
jgi:hypothetical protein